MFRRRSARRPAHRGQDPNRMPYDMFDMDRTAQEVHAAKKLEGIYHKGQNKAWNGKEVLAELVEKHGGVNLAPEKLDALARLFSVIFWGELAAWKVASELALQIEPLEAKMAATSQAHDEARHFYVLHDYLSLVGYTPGVIPVPASQMLERIVGASNLAKKLIGMQLMVEPIALTLFQMVRESELEPVLCDLLRRFELDEARHIALGIHHLPALLREMRPRELLDLWHWQTRMFMLEIDGLKLMENDFRTLGFSPREAFRLGQAKQLAAGKLMQQELGYELPIVQFFTRIVEFRMQLVFHDDHAPNSFPHRMGRAMRGIVYGPSDLDPYLARALAT